MLCSRIIPYSIIALILQFISTFTLLDVPCISLKSFRFIGSKNSSNFCSGSPPNFIQRFIIQFMLWQITNFDNYLLLVSSVGNLNLTIVLILCLIILYAIFCISFSTMSIVSNTLWVYRIPFHNSPIVYLRMQRTLFHLVSRSTFYFQNV